MKKRFAFAWLFLLLSCGKAHSQHVPASDLQLYVMTSCPYCVKVHRTLDEIGVTVKIKDISKNNNYRMELVRIGGKAQVPCLVIKGKAMYESDAIIAWLKENFKK